MTPVILTAVVVFVSSCIGFLIWMDIPIQRHPRRLLRYLKTHPWVLQPPHKLERDPSNPVWVCWQVTPRVTVSYRGPGHEGPLHFVSVSSTDNNDHTPLEFDDSGTLQGSCSPQNRSRLEEVFRLVQAELKKLGEITEDRR